MSNNNDGAFSSNIKEIKMTTTIYNGLEYTTREINSTFKIKVNGLFNGKKINTLVGVYGLLKLVGVGKEEPPNVTDTPGVRYAVTESDILVMRYCKGRLKILLYNVLGKNCLENKGYIFGN